MTRVLIWDLPTRLFHWLLSAGFVAAAFIALVLGDDSALFPYHAIIGSSLALMVCLRVVWGFLGSRYARFGTFAFGPGAALEYFRGVVKGTGKRHVGHNPGSAYAIFAMLALLLGLAVTGVMMSQGNESVEEVHEVLAYAMVALVMTHVLGVVIHTVRHRENIVASMVHGSKEADPSAGIPSSQPLVGALFVVLVGAWTLGLLVDYDPSTRSTTVPILGTRLQLGEVEDEGEEVDD